jgi:hypothetical protein
LLRRHQDAAHGAYAPQLMLGIETTPPALTENGAQASSSTGRHPFTQTGIVRHVSGAGARRATAREPRGCPQLVWPTPKRTGYSAPGVMGRGLPIPRAVPGSGSLYSAISIVSDGSRVTRQAVSLPRCYSIAFAISAGRSKEFGPSASADRPRADPWPARRAGDGTTPGRPPA